MSQTLVLISNDLKDREFAAAAATVSGLNFAQVKTPAEGVELMSREEKAVVMVDASSQSQYQEFENAIQTKMGLFSDKVNANLIHFISATGWDHVQYLVQSPIFGHFIFRNFSDPTADGRHYGRVLKATLLERAFGLAHLLEDGCKIQNVKIAVSSQKHNMVEAVKAFLLAAKFKARMATTVANAVDELIMNAIFDAPVDELGRPTLTTTPRATVIELVGKSAVEIQVGFDGTYAGVSAVDLYGSLDKGKLLTHISKMYINEEYKVRTSSAGAGIGLATVFQSGGSFFFVSESRIRTEVTVFFKRTSSFLEFKDQFRFMSTQFYF